MADDTYTCSNGSDCPCRQQVEYDLLIRAWFIIVCSRCGKVYHGKANGKLIVREGEG